MSGAAKPDTNPKIILFFDHRYSLKIFTDCERPLTEEEFQAVEGQITRATIAQTKLLAQTMGR